MIEFLKDVIVIQWYYIVPIKQAYWSHCHFSTYQNLQACKRSISCNVDVFDDLKCSTNVFVKFVSSNGIKFNMDNMDIKYFSSLKILKETQETSIAQWWI